MRFKEYKEKTKRVYKNVGWVIHNEDETTLEVHARHNEIRRRYEWLKEDSEVLGIKLGKECMFVRKFDEKNINGIYDAYIIMVSDMKEYKILRVDMGFESLDKFNVIRKDGMLSMWVSCEEKDDDAEIMLIKKYMKIKARKEPRYRLKYLFI